MATYSALPATLNLVATVGNDFSLALTVTESGSPWVATGATLATDIIDSSGAVVATDFTTAASTGTVSLSLTDTNTTTLGVGVYSYRLSVTKSSLTRDWIAGTLSIVEAGQGGSSTSSASLAISNSAVTLSLTSLVAPLAENISVADAGGYYTGTDVEAVLAELPSKFATGASLVAYGLDGSTANIATPIADAVAAGQRHIIVPYRASAWPATTKITLSNVWLDFEPGARIAFNHSDQGMELTGCRLTNASFTSTYTGPASAGDAVSAAYAFPAREVKLNSDCTVDGGYFHEYATNGLHITGSNVSLQGPLTFTNMRHQQGWAAAIHLDGSTCFNVTCDGFVKVTSSDRGIEVENGANRATFNGGGYMSAVYPAGYTGSGSAASYATYTFVLDAHAHENEGGPYAISYGGVWTLENCGGGVSFVRSSGTNDTDLPRECRVDEVRFLGQALGTSYESVALQGYGHHVGRVVFEDGAGITGSFGVRQYAGSSGVTVGEVVTNDSASAAALAITGSPSIGVVGADFVSSLGYDAGLVGSVLAGGGVTNPNANAAILVRVRARRTIRVGVFRWYAQTASGNYDVGIYNAAGTRLWSKGSTAAPATGVVTETVSPTVTIRAGDEFFVALATDNTTQTYKGVTLAATTMCNDLTGRPVALSVSTSFPLPSTITPGSSAVARIPAITLHES